MDIHRNTWLKMAVANNTDRIQQKEKSASSIKKAMKCKVFLIIFYLVESIHQNVNPLQQ